MGQISLSWEPARRIFSVRDLTQAIDRLLHREFADVWVSGEISGLKIAASGHCYFVLKDAEAQVRCACYRNTYRLLRFKPQDGLAVLAHGNVEVYAARGEYQLIVDLLEPQGLGALQLAFEQLKKKLEAEGLFKPERKRPLPRLPRRIGIVTSPTGAVIRDMIQILTRRLPGIHIRLYPALVQGAGSIEQVCEGIEHFSRSGWPEVVVVGRGGGSLEDLWTFNEEAVARAIAASAVPVISAVGHETDFTIADFVADLRAPTPSAAAELVTPTEESLLDRIGSAEWKLRQGVRLGLERAGRRLFQQGIHRAVSTIQRRINTGLQRTDEAGLRLRQSAAGLLVAARRRREVLDFRLRRMDLRLRFAGIRGRLDQAARLAAERIRLRLYGEHRRLEPLAAQLAGLSPLRILDRGYSIVQDESGAIVKDAASVAPDALVGIRLARGGLRARVTGRMVKYPKA